jgi:hypothetical protein
MRLKSIRNKKTSMKKGSKKVLARKPHRSYEKVFRTDKPPFKEVYIVDDFCYQPSFKSVKT